MIGNKVKVFTFKMLNVVKTLRSEFKMFFFSYSTRKIPPSNIGKRGSPILVKILNRATERPIVLQNIKMSLPEYYVQFVIIV